jgi:hypothetical protein
MAESANSLPVSITPFFVASKFQEPSWHVRVNGAIVPNAILDRVELGFGSDISSAAFFLPKNPITSSGNPVQDDIVEVLSNGKVIFKGPIRVISDHIGNDGLKISYTAFSDIVDLNKKTIINGAFNSDNADYRLYLYNLPPIFSILGIPCSPPNVYPGEVNVTDQTLLAAGESLLNKVGNYKMYYDMVNQALSIYEFQTGGLNTRSFLPGKNIIKYDINKSIENTVDEVSVVGPPIQVTEQQAVYNPQLRIAPSGRYELAFTLSGRNIRNVTVEGQTRDKPNIEYDMSMKINRDMIAKYQGLFINDPMTFRTENFPLSDSDSSEVDAGSQLLPKVVHHYENTTEWSQVPVTVEQHGRDLITIYISEVPKVWETFFTGADIPNSVFGLPNPDQTSYVEVVDMQDFMVGAMRVTFTVDGGKPIVSVGSGDVQRSITDSQYQITTDYVTGVNNSARILQAMQIRANAEYARLHYPRISGTITVLGDETIDLRQTVLIEGLLLDVVHVTHNFTNGYTTDVTLTNERFVPSIILRPPQWMPPRNLETEKEKRKGLLIYNVDCDITLNKNNNAKNEKKNNEEPPNDNGFAILK